MWRGGGGEIQPYLREWKTHLNAEGGEGALGACPSGVARVAAVACARLSQPPSVLFLAADLFGRFADAHLRRSVAETASATVAAPVEFSRRWTAVEGQLKRQALLRLACCLHLASKAVQNEGSTSKDRIAAYLRSCDQFHSDHSFLASERKVFQMLDYRIPVFGIIDAAEYLIETCIIPNGRDPSLIHPTCEAILKFIYFSNEQFKSKLFSTLGRKLGEDEKKPFKTLLAASVVLTAAKITQSKDTSRLIKYMSFYIDRAEEDIQGISFVILSTIIE